MPNEETRFLDEGLRRYAEARQIIRGFEEILEARLEKIISEKSDWTAFVKDRGKKSVKVAHADGGTGDPTILAIIKGKTADGHKAQIHAGLIWRAGLEGVQVFARFRQPKHLVGFEPHTRSRRVKFFKIKDRKTFLYVVLDDVAKLETDLNLVLDELQRHVVQEEG